LGEAARPPRSVSGTGLEPSLSQTQMLVTPLRSDAKASLWPSGE